MSLLDLHPFEDAAYAPGSCDVCGGAPADHSTKLRRYEIAWRAVVAGVDEVWAHTGNEARQQVLANQDVLLNSRAAVGSPYDEVLEAVSGRLVRITGVTLKRGHAG